MNDADFGRVLRKMRTDSGKTVPEVSAHLTALGYKAATQTIYGWERGLSQPNPDPFLAMCKFYGVKDIFSYFGDDPMEISTSPSAAKAAPGDIFADIEQQYGHEAHRAFSMYVRLDKDDQGEIRGEMKQMLKGEKYRATPLRQGEKHGSCLIFPGGGKVLYLNCSPPE